MSKIFTLFTLIILSLAPLSTFAQPVPPVFFTPNDLYNHYKSMDEKLEAIEIGTVLYNPHQRVRSDEWHNSIAWFGEKFVLLLQEYDLTSADVYLNVKDVEMARWVIAALSNVKSLTILCHTKFDQQTKLSFKALTQKWERAGKSLMVIDAGVEDENITAFCSCFLAAQIQQILGDGTETTEVKQEILDGLRELRKEARVLGEKRRASMALGEDVPDNDKLAKVNAKIGGIEKALMVAVELVTPDMHPVEKCAFFTGFFEDEVEVSETLQALLAGFIQKRKAVWPKRTPKSNRDNYVDIIKTLTQLNDQEAALVMERAASDFNHVVDDISPYVELIAQFLYPQRFTGRDSLYEAAEKRIPTKGFEAYQKKYEACLAAFPLSKLDDEAALSLIKSYFLNPIDDKFYKWGAELYEFGPELGQQFAALPADKQEDAFQLAKYFREVAFPSAKSSNNDDDEVIVHELFSLRILNDWTEALKLICFMVEKTDLSQQEKPEGVQRYIDSDYGGMVTTLAHFYKEHNRLPCVLLNFNLFPGDERLGIMKQIMPFVFLLKVKRDQVSLFLKTFKELRENNSCSDIDQLGYLREIWPVFSCPASETLKDLQYFLIHLPFDRRENILVKARRLLKNQPDGWEEQMVQINKAYQQALVTVSRRPSQPKGWGESFQEFLGFN